MESLSSEAKAEERTYEEFDEEQNIDGMNEYLKDAKDKLTSTPFISEAKPNNQTALKVPAVKFQGSAFVSTAGADTGGVDRVDIHPPFFSKKKFEMSLYLK